MLRDLGRIKPQAHSPVDTDHLAGDHWEPDIFSLEGFARKDQVVDEARLCFLLAFLREAWAEVALGAERLVSAVVEVFSAMMSEHGGAVGEQKS